MAFSANLAKIEEKKQKELRRAEEKAKKEAEFQAKLVEQFNDKQAKAKAAGNTTHKLKEWLQNPPYKCSDAKLQVNQISFVCDLVLVGDSILHPVLFAAAQARRVGKDVRRGQRQTGCEGCSSAEQVPDGGNGPAL